jgi:hypothetical protein
MEIYRIKAITEADFGCEETTVTENMDDGFSG